jgi:hypothetical protein
MSVNPPFPPTPTTHISPIVISETQRLATAWCASFAANSPPALSSIFTPDGEWIDHGFNIRRRGRSALETHYSLWMRANPDFTATITQFWPNETGGVIKYVGKGTMTGDLPSEKARGNAFEMVGLVEFVVRKEAGEGWLIEKIEELYRRDFWNSKTEEGYHFISKL